MAIAIADRCRELGLGRLEDEGRALLGAEARDWPALTAWVRRASEALCALYPPRVPRIRR